MSYIPISKTNPQPFRGVGWETSGYGVRGGNHFPLPGAQKRKTSMTLSRNSDIILIHPDDNTAVALKEIPAGVFFGPAGCRLPADHTGRA